MSEKTATSQNYIRDEVSKLNTRNDRCHLCAVCTFFSYPRNQMTLTMYGCETWSLKMREESRLRLFENRVLKRMFGPKRDKVTGEWRKVHNEELIELYSPNVIRVSQPRWMRRVGHVARTWERRGVYRFW